MARKLRLEFEGGVYHVINRGNYRADIFRGEKTRAAFLKCLGEACEKTGWRVHAWCIMSNHYHVAVETPAANLVEGMRWLQGTFATRFNRLRQERGHLFQGRYKSLLIAPGHGLGALCHYIHLNPVRAKVRAVTELGDWPWSSMRWLLRPAERAKWFDPNAALEQAGGLTDTPAGRRKYVEYLAWLAEDEPARRALNFERMSRGWCVGTRDFVKELRAEHREAAGRSGERSENSRFVRESVWADELERLLRRLDRKRAELAATGKSEPWKLAVAAALKARTTVTNRWLTETLALGHPDEASRKVAAWQREPDAALARKVGFTPNPKV